MEKHDFADIWGACLAELKAEEDMSSMRIGEEPAARQSRGGGRCRAFVSKLAKLPEYRKPNGKCDFAKIMLAWQSEMENPTGLLDGCTQAGQRGTFARRGQVSSGANLYQVSSFGSIHERAKKRSRTELQDGVVIEQLDALNQASQGRQVESSDDVLALVAHGDLKEAFFDLVLARQSDSIREKLAAIDHLSRKLAARQRAQDETFEAQHRQEMQEQPLPNIDMKALENACRCKFRVMQRDDANLITVRPWVNLRRWAEDKVATMVKERNRKHLVVKAYQLWKQEHQLEPNPEELGDIPADARPPYCSEVGFGTCLCSGNGHVHRLAKDRLANRLAKEFPKKSIERSWAKRGFLVIQLNAEMYHISLLYLKPKRPTFTKVGGNGEVWGRRCVIPLTQGGKLLHYLDFSAVEEHDLTYPLSFALWKLVHFKKAGDEVGIPWVPSAKLTIEPYHEHSSRTTTSTFPFWKGAAAELEAEAKEEEAKKRRDAARRERQAAGLEEPKRRPRRKGNAPRPKPKKTASQARHVAEVCKDKAEITLAIEDVQKEDEEEEQDKPSEIDSESTDSREAEWFADMDAAMLMAEAKATIGDEAFHLADEPDGHDSAEDAAVQDLFSDDDEGKAAPLAAAEAEGKPEEFAVADHALYSPISPAFAADEAKETPAAADHALYSTTSPASAADEAKETPAAADGDGSSTESADTSSSDSSDATADAGPGKLVEDLNRDHEAPAGAYFRRLKRGGEPVCWKGKLPAGRTDDLGRASRQRNFGHHIRSLEDAKADVLMWLNLWS